MDRSIYILSEPIHKGTHWYMQIMNAVTARAAHHKLPVRHIRPDQADLIPAACAPVLILGATSSWLQDTLRQLDALQLTALAVGVDFPKAWDGLSVITCSQARMAQDAVRCMYAAGRKKLAFVGFNPFSFNDQAKLDGMQQMCVQLGLCFSTEDVFSFGGSMEQCIQAFAQRYQQYDGVLCANDVAGLWLMRRFQGLVPQSLYVISFGNMLLSRLTAPTLTTISFNYGQMGTTAVNTLLYLRKNREISCQHTAVNAQIIPGDSTRGASSMERSTLLDSTLPAPSGASGFYRDPSSQQIFQVEAALTKLDELEWKLVRMMLDGRDRKDILDSLYISDSTYKYRMRRICENAGVKNRSELRKLLESWIDLEQLKVYMDQSAPR